MDLPLLQRNRTLRAWLARRPAIYSIAIALLCVAIGFIGGCGSGGSSPSAVPSTSLQTVFTEDTAVQLNPSHSGTIYFGNPLTFPVAPAWSATLSGNSFYPLIADGTVFVTAADSTPDGAGSNLYAFKLATGKLVWGPIALGGRGWSGITWDNGRIFALNDAGVLRAFNAASGTLTWVVNVNGQIWQSPPTAANGAVYVNDDLQMAALSESTGSTLWSTSLEQDEAAAPAVQMAASGATTAIFASADADVTAFNPVDGSLLWQYIGSSGGSGNATPAYTNGSLYVTSALQSSSSEGAGALVLNSTNGTVVGNFASNVLPALTSTTMYCMQGGTLRSINRSTNAVNWSFAGDGTLESAPILMDQTLFIGGSSGAVYALNAGSGKQLWKATVAGGGFAGPFLGAAQGYLVVPSASILTVWRLSGS